MIVSLVTSNVVLKLYTIVYSSDLITRSQTNEELHVVVPKPNLEMFRQSIVYQGPRIGNGLPITMLVVLEAPVILNFLRTWLSLFLKNSHYLF